MLDLRAMRSNEQCNPPAGPARARADHRLPLPAERQSGTGDRIRLQARERLHKYGKTLIAADAPFMAGDYNVMPTDLDVYAPERWRDDALFRPEVRKAYAEFVKLGWQDALGHLYPGKRIYIFWKYFRKEPPRCGRRRTRGAQLGKNQRSRAGLDRAEGSRPIRLRKRARD
jgi:hypothetical protein